MIWAIKKLDNPKIKLFISLSTLRDGFEKEMIVDFSKIPSFLTVLEPRNDIAAYYRSDFIYFGSEGKGILLCNSGSDVLWNSSD